MTDKPILFISDLHLEPDRPDISQAFLIFWKSMQVRHRLYISLVIFLMSGLVMTTAPSLAFKWLRN